MASKYYKVYTAVKPFAKIAGQKTVGTIKSAAKKAKQKFDETLKKTDKVLKKFGKTVDKQKKILGDK